VVRAGKIAVLAAGMLLLAGASAHAKTFEPTKTADTFDGHCTHADCSLRDAITASNNTVAEDKIKLKAKSYRLTLPFLGGGTNEAGSLDVTNDVRLVGAGAAGTAIEGAWAVPLTGLILVRAGAKLSISGATLRNGDAGNDTGGAVFVESGAALNLKGVDLVSNRAELGSAIDNYGHAVLRRVLFKKNHATGCCTYYEETGSTGKLTDVTFDHNTTVNDSAGMYSDGAATLKNVTFSNNKSGSTGGGGLFVDTPVEVSLTNVTFSGNSSGGPGGAIDAQGGTLDLNNVTITGNHSDDDGGGLEVSGATVNIQNSIIAGNTNPSSVSPNCGGIAPTSLGHNLIGDLTGCAWTGAAGDMLDIAAPGLSALAANGGFTKTIALKGSSPAVDKGSSKKPGSGGTACDAHDQRGVKRPQGKRCDIGAYERK
jgi:CSLREA domain-containing protein